MEPSVENILQKQQKYLVVGDVMLDRYIIGQVNRISSEAPVPVLKVSSHESRPGGAANVALNLQELHTQVTLIGCTGSDAAGQELLSLLESRSIQLKPVYWQRNTITKTRVVSSRQQIARFDEEQSPALTPAELLKLTEYIDNEDFSAYNGIILSDYANGVCNARLCSLVISKANTANIPVFVDPRNKEWSMYHGAKVLTPNMKEISDAFGRTVENNDLEVEKAGRHLLEKFNLDNLIVTRSAMGMSLINHHTAEHYPTMARDVYDVSGAGDTVLACLARFHTAGQSLKEAIGTANLAAGIVVAHAGTCPITAKELLAASSGLNSNTLSISAIKAMQKKGKKIVFTNGCFDILHAGHVDYLRQAKQLGDLLIVGLNSDASVRRLKGPQRPFNSQQARKAMLEALRWVDRVEIFDQDTPYDLIKEIQPDILVKGGDYSLQDIIGSEFAQEAKIIPFKEGYSTTLLVEKIKKSHE